MKENLFLLKFAKAILRVIYSPMKLRRSTYKVTILSRQSDDPSVDIALLADYFRKNHPEMILKIMCRKLEDNGMAGYAMHVLSQMWNIANSRVVILDGYSIAASVLDHKKETIIVQMWHALAAIKKFGYQNLGKPGGRSRNIADIMCMHRNYSFVLAPSSETGRIFCEAFNTDSFKVVLMGLPRIDAIMSSKKISDQQKKKLRHEYDIPPEKEIILYAPTIRKSGELDVRDLVESIDKNRFILVICPHPLDAETGTEADAKNTGVIADRKYDAHTWLDACDRVITDYSAISVEASLKNKPLYFYVHDIHEYMADEGLNFDPREQLPKVTAERGDALMKKMDADYPFEELDAFRCRFIEVDTEDCTGKLGEYINGLVKTTD